MTSGVSEYIPLFAAAIPFIYFLIVLYSASRYFAQAKNAPQSASDFTPPVSNLKPVRGLDPEAYENFASSLPAGLSRIRIDFLRYRPYRSLRPCNPQIDAGLS